MCIIRFYFVRAIIVSGQYREAGYDLTVGRIYFYYFYIIVYRKALNPTQLSAESSEILLVRPSIVRLDDI